MGLLYSQYVSIFVTSSRTAKKAPFAARFSVSVVKCVSEVNIQRQSLNSFKSELLSAPPLCLLCDGIMVNSSQTSQASPLQCF